MKRKRAGLQEFNQIYERYGIAIDREDYQEARKLNELLYENEFLKYRMLVEMKRLFEKQGARTKVRKLGLMIDDVTKKLEVLLEMGLELVYIQGGELGRTR